MNLNLIIANNLKRLRTGRGLSLGQLSGLCGVSKVMLSQIEKGESNPTVNTILKIANGLKVPYTVLIDEPRQESYVISKAAAAEQFTEDGSYRLYRYCGTTANRNFELFLAEIDPDTDYTSVGHPEKAEEYILVTEGELVLKALDNTYVLKPWDSFHFPSTRPHVYRNISGAMVKAIIINFYPI